MSVYALELRRAFAAVAALMLLASGLAVARAEAADGVAPDIVSLIDVDLDVDPGEKRALEIEATGIDSGAIFEFSGTGLAVTAYRVKSGGVVRLHLLASSDAEGGFRDLTVTNPDGLSDTYPNAMLVTGAPQELGDLTLHVFEDLDGNGVEDGAETGLAGVAIDVADVNGVGYNVVTDASGNAALVDVSAGDATVTYTTPTAMALTTANDVQTVTVVANTSTAALAVGFQTIPNGAVAGYVFGDLDGNGIQDGSETGLAGVAVTVTDADGVVHDAVTDASGNYSVPLLPLGNADLAYAGPIGHTLTTGNDTQVLTVTDGGTATAADVGYQPPDGDVPQILGMQDANPEIDPGSKKHFTVDVLNFIDGGTASLSGSGLTVKVRSLDSTTIKISVVAASDAAAGPRDLTVTNPGGGSDTLVAALTVTGDITPPPVSGTVAGHVFEDLDGNGIEDGADTGLANLGVSFVDESGATWPGVTDVNGDFSLAVGVGTGTLTVSGSPGATLTTGNNIQVLTIVEGLETLADSVGYEPPSGDTSFLNVATAAGITTNHSATGQCGAAIGVGSAWADVDNDGDLDLFTTNRNGANTLYRNNGDLDGDGIVDFTDVAVALGIDAPSDDSFSTVFIDYDNDGDQDLFVANSSGNTLWENQLVGGGGVLAFTDVSGTAGLDDQGRIQTVTWGDVDNDGFLDVYFAKHMTCAVDGDTIDRLFRNNGDGTFSDWTTYLCGGGAVPCADVSGLGFAAGMFDYDNDGDTDIYLVNDNIAGNNQPNKLWRNDGPDGANGWIFVEVGAAANVDLSVNGMGLGIGDYNNDGLLDLAFSDSGPGHLLMNDGDGTFTDVSNSSGVTAALEGGVSWGTAFLDYNNDGWQDLFYAQGSIGTAAPLASALLENLGTGMFADATAITGMGDEARARNVSIADFNADGWVDVYVGNYDAYPLLMQNMSAVNGNTNQWLTITVEGTQSNRDGIGAVISVTTTAGTQSQLISSGGNHGGGSEKAAFFGLGSDTAATVSIAWPNGVVQNLGSVNASQAVHFVEPTS